MTKPDLSLCMIVKDEAQNLRLCLESVRELAPEVIVVDTGSTDGTQEIAKDFGAQVIPFDFQVVDFSAARNAGLGRARGRWILVLDADETLEADALPKIREIIGANLNAGYYLERNNYASDSTNVTTDFVVRLFPNHSCYRYKGRVHETIDEQILAYGGRLKRSGIGLTHKFASDRESRRRKNFWYIKILQEEIAANPQDDTRLDFLAAEYHQLEMYAEAAAVAQRLVEMRPQDARAQLFLGVYHFLYVPDFNKAREEFGAALKLKPGYPEAESFLRLLDAKEGLNAG